MLALLALVCYFIRCLAPSVAFGAQVLPAAASYHSTIPPARPTFSEIFLCVEKNNNSKYLFPQITIVPISTNNGDGKSNFQILILDTS